MEQQTRPQTGRVLLVRYAAFFAYRISGWSRVLGERPNKTLLINCRHSPALGRSNPEPGKIRQQSPTVS